MISPIKNNQTILAKEKNVLILFGGTLTIERNDTLSTVPANTFFFFEEDFKIVAASPFLEGFVTRLDVDFLSAFEDITQALDRIVPPFAFMKIKQVERKRNQIRSILQTDGKTRLQESYLHILWTEFIQDFEETQKEKGIVEQFSELIDQNIKQNYCAGTYAEMMGVSLKKLIKEVKKSENKTPCNFITDKVIENAKHKLTQTEDTSQMIAYQLGFDDPYYFIKYFKKNTQLTPTQYRAQYQLN